MNSGESAAYAAKLRALLPLMDAHARGESIEFRLNPSCVLWTVATFPTWVHPAECYRIKPKPRTFYLIRYRDGSCMSFLSTKARDEYLEKFTSAIIGTEMLTVIEQL